MQNELRYQTVRYVKGVFIKKNVLIKGSRLALVGANLLPANCKYAIHLFSSKIPFLPRPKNDRFVSILVYVLTISEQNSVSARINSTFMHNQKQYRVDFILNMT